MIGRERCVEHGAGSRKQEAESTVRITYYALCMALLLGFGLFGLGPVLAASDDPASPGPLVLRADVEGVVLEWRAPTFSQRPVVGDDGHFYVALDAPGWDQTEVSGQPQLPSASALVVVPPSGDVMLQVQVLESSRRSLPSPVAPAPKMAVIGDPPAGLEPVWARDERLYARAGLYPGEVVTLEEVGWMRGRRLVRLTFFPLRFDPTESVLEVTRHVRVELSFQDAPAAAQGWGGDDPFVSILQHTVVNPGQVTQFARSLSSYRGEAGGSALTLAGAPSDTEYLIIAHSNFINAVAPLAAHRATSDGLKVYSTTVEAIGGSDDPVAIRDYISNTYHSAVTPTLEYVLLVGDGVESGTSGQYISPYMITMEEGDPPWWPSEWDPQVAASDNRFVTVDGDDKLADVFIGRLPVNSVAEAETVVQKILDYELNPPQYPWNERVLFFAGNEDPDANPPETFHEDSDSIYNTLPITFTGRRAYFCTDDCSEYYKYDDITAAHDATMRRLDAGGLLASYVGHSSWQQWAMDPATFAPLFHVDDVASLHNGGALPVFLGMTCYTGRFAYPSGGTLDEELLRRAGGGAVATWGSTTLGRTSGHKVLHQRFFDAVFTDGVTELGTVTEYAKAGLAGSGDADLLDTFVLLGDPAMNLNLTIVPWTDAIFLPLVLRGG